MRLARCQIGLIAMVAMLAIEDDGVVLSGQTAPESPVELVRQTFMNEVATTDNGAKFMFLDHKEGSHGSQTKLIVETREGMAGMLVAVNGRPLNPEQRQAEEGRLAGLMSNPEELRKK